MDYEITIKARYKKQKLKGLEVSTDPKNEDKLPNERLIEILKEALDVQKNITKMFDKERNDKG